MSKNKNWDLLPESTQKILALLDRVPQSVREAADDVV